MKVQLIAQENFQKIYLLEDTFALFHDIYVTDSGYYFGASTGKGNRCDIAFGKLSLNGELQYFQKQITPFEYNQSNGGRTQLDTNFRGSFMFGYTNKSSNGAFPHITEVDVNGNVINDLELDLFKNDSLDFYDFGKILVSNSDSSYYIFFTYNDRKTDNNPSVGANGETGALLGKVKWTGDTLWTKRFYNPLNDFYRPHYIVNEFTPYLDHYLLSVTEANAYFDWGDLSWSKVHFFEVDASGNTLNHKIFQDDINTVGGYGMLTLSDGSIIHGYNESQLFGISPNEYLQYRPVLSRLNSDFQQLWRDTLNSTWTNLVQYAPPMQLRQVNDTIFAGMQPWYYKTMYDPEIWNTLRVIQKARIFNRHINGNIIWNRDYVFWAITDSINEPDYTLWDFELTNDGGFITCGNVINIDSINILKPGQYGYVLKTNCLGFLGDPISEFSYSTNNGEVEFDNEGIQAGSYTWIFGDGGTLNTSEYVDTVNHIYSDNGDYTVQLIAFGCNGKNDTITKTITVSGISSGYAGDGTLLTIYPNPISSGESLAFYVGDIADKNVTVEIVNSVGQIVFQGIVQTPNTTYIVPLNVAAGEYFVSLRNESDRLEVEKLIVR